MFALSPHRRATSRYCTAIGRFGWYRVPNASNVRQIPSRDFGFELKILPIAELLPAIKVKAAEDQDKPRPAAIHIRLFTFDIISVIALRQQKGV